MILDSMVVVLLGLLTQLINNLGTEERFSMFFLKTKMCPKHISFGLFSDVQISS